MLSLHALQTMFQPPDAQCRISGCELKITGGPVPVDGQSLINANRTIEAKYERDYTAYNIISPFTIMKTA